MHADVSFALETSKRARILFTAVFGCLFFGAAFMFSICSYPNALSFVAGMLLLAFFAFMYLLVLRSLWHARVVVAMPAFTVVPALGRSRTYDISEITRVIYRRNGGTTGYKIYAGRRKILRVDSGMVNCAVFISMLKERGVPFH